MRRNVRRFLLASVFLTLTACENGTPTVPTPPPTCSFALSATTLSLPAAGGPATVNVSTGAQCTWTSTSDREWMTITSGANGTGNGTVAVLIAPNPGTTVRTGTLTIAGQAVAVSEAAQPPCQVSLTPPGASIAHDAGTGTFTVTAPSYCQWTAVSAASWLKVTSGASGTGTGTVAYAVDRNQEIAGRSAAITVSGAPFVVNQAGDLGACTFSVSPVQFTPCMPGGFTMTATVSTQATCPWTATATSGWITLTGGQSGSGPGAVSFTVTDNYDAPRQGVVEVRWPTATAGQNLQVLQAGCVYAVSTGTINIPAGGGPGHFDVFQQALPNTCGGATQNNCIWTASATASWIVISTSMPQQGDNRVNFTVTPNTTGAARSATIVVKDKVVTIMQAGS